jgi:hypothetical protein
LPVTASTGPLSTWYLMARKSMYSGSPATSCKHQDGPALTMRPVGPASPSRGHGWSGRNSQQPTARMDKAQPAHVGPWTGTLSPSCLCLTFSQSKG